MKTLIASLLLIGAMAPAVAGPYRHHGHHGHHGYHGHWARGYNGGWNWMVPAIIGGAVVYGVTRPDPVIVQPPVQIPQGQNCSPWTETQNSDGTITRTRTCTQ